jgi:hypothetical protein
VSSHNLEIRRRLTGTVRGYLHCIKRPVGPQPGRQCGLAQDQPLHRPIPTHDVGASFVGARRLPQQPAGWHKTSPYIASFRRTM